MAECSHCGAPLTGIVSERVICRFCGTSNEPPPKEVEVPVAVQIVHNVVQVAGSKEGQPVELRCPRCRKRLVAVQVKGVELNGCGGCGGIWIDNGSARKVLAAPEGIFAELAERAGANARRGARGTLNTTCAVCPAALDEVATHGIQVDVCGEHGTWFDAYELRQFVLTLRGEKPAPPRDPEQGSRCQSCGITVEGGRGNVTEYGMLCEGCWRTRQSAEVAAERETEERIGKIMTDVLVAVLTPRRQY